MLKLRRYQADAVERCRAAYAAGARRVVLVSPTGSGKTHMGCFIAMSALAKGRRILWLAARRELVDQARKEMPVPAGVILSGRTPSDAPIQIASVQTITARETRPSAAFIVQDECHHSVASTHRAIIEAYPSAFVLGLTATPERGDGAALGDVFDDIVQGPSVRELVRLGRLVPCDVIAPVSRGDALGCEPVEAWRRFAPGRPGFLFAKTVEQSKQLVRQFREVGISAEHVDGKTSKKIRDHAVQRFREGQTDVLSSVGVFTEGFDVPRAEVCMLARAPAHASTYLQMVGRVLRTSPEKGRALLLDLHGVVHVHGLPEDERTYSLEGVPITDTEAAEPIRQCSKCGAVFRPRPECPRCGFVLPPPESPKVVERELKKIDKPNTDVFEASATYRHLISYAREMGYKPGWADHRFKQMFGRWPKRGMRR